MSKVVLIHNISAYFAEPSLEDKLKELLDLVPEIDRNSFFLGAGAALKVILTGVQDSGNWRKHLADRIEDTDAEVREFIQTTYGAPREWDEFELDEGGLN